MEDDLIEVATYKYLRILKPKDGRIKRVFYVFDGGEELARVESDEAARAEIDEITKTKYRAWSVGRDNASGTTRPIPNPAYWITPPDSGSLMGSVTFGGATLEAAHAKIDRIVDNPPDPRTGQTQFTQDQRP